MLALGVNANTVSILARMGDPSFARTLNIAASAALSADEPLHCEHKIRAAIGWDTDECLSCGASVYAFEQEGPCKYEHYDSNCHCMDCRGL